MHGLRSYPVAPTFGLRRPEFLGREGIGGARVENPGLAYQLGQEEPIDHGVAVREAVQQRRDVAPELHRPRELFALLRDRAVRPIMREGVTVIVLEAWRVGQGERAPEEVSDSLLCRGGIPPTGQVMYNGTSDGNPSRVGHGRRVEVAVERASALVRANGRTGPGGGEVKRRPHSAVGRPVKPSAAEP
jgi:hypothetical protein